MSSVELKLFDTSGKEVGTVPVPAELFDRKPGRSMLHQMVRWQLNKRRAGTHSVLTRAEMSGGGTKPWRQKGLGRARSGSNTSPLWVGGGVAHGPKPRDYSFWLNKKERKQALAGAVSARRNEGKCLIIQDFGLSEIKTKKAAQMLRSLGIEKGKTAVVVTSGDEENAEKSLRNLPGLVLLRAEGLNVYDVIRCEYLVMTEKALAAVEQRFASRAEG